MCVDPCGDQLFVNCFDITNIYIHIFDKDVIYRSAHVTKLYITNLYKQDAVSVTRLQLICEIGFEFASKLQKHMPLCNMLDSNMKLTLKPCCFNVSSMFELSK